MTGGTTRRALTATDLAPLTRAVLGPSFMREIAEHSLEQIISLLMNPARS